MQVSVLGCGWLGHRLCLQLLKGGHAVKGSTTSAEKIEPLRQDGIDAFLLNLDNVGAGAIEAFLKGSAILIINIPPKVKTATVPYAYKVGLLLPFIEAAGITNVLFVSSTSVYADAFPFPVVTEETLPNPQSESGRQVLEAEKVLQSATAFQTTIIRPAGLVGAGRHPVHHLAGKTGLDNPGAPVNLAGRENVVAAILAVMGLGKWNETFNVSHPLHPSREVYYTAKARSLGLPLPQFSTAAPSVGKYISSEKAQNVLGIRFDPEI
jgi:nucleoside-diphosphate-sugar epimerase